MLIIPKILVIANKHKLYDNIDDRKNHSGAVPRIGGVSFVPCILFSVLLSFGIYYLIGDKFDIKEEIPDNMQFYLFFCGLILLYLGGIKDDLVGLRFFYKFILQFAAAIIMLFSGIYINNLHGFLWINYIPSYIGIPLTVLVIVFITNAINLIDGIDGLAAGISIFALSVYGVMYFNQGLWTYSVLSFSTVGVLIPFFWYNVFGNVKRGRKLFMGDSGSLTLGFILSYLSVHYVCIPSDSQYLSSHSFVIAFSALLVPFLDILRVILVRFKKHTNLFMPDRNHIHHKLQYLGLSNTSALIFILLFNILMFCLNVFMIGKTNSTFIFLTDLIIWILCNMILSKNLKRKSTVPKGSI